MDFFIGSISFYNESKNLLFNITKKSFIQSILTISNRVNSVSFKIEVKVAVSVKGIALLPYELPGLAIAPGHCEFGVVYEI